MAARDQVHADSSARTCRTHRWPRSIGRNHHRLGKRRIAEGRKFKADCAMKSRRERKESDEMQPNKTRADLWMDLLLMAFLIALNVVARLLPHAPGFLPVAASGLFAARYLRIPRSEEHT